MKIVRALMIVSMLVVALGVFSHPASAIFYSYTSGYQVQNLSASTATLVITYYDEQTGSSTGGTLNTTASDTIAASGSKTYFPIHATAGFKGSVVISSDQPLATIVNLVATGVGNASYIGSTTGSTTVNLPLLMKANAGITTWYSVQNTGSTDATVTVDYSDIAGTSNAGPIVIKPNAEYTFDQGAEATHTAKVFAGTLTSTQPVAVVVVQEGTVVRTILSSAGFGSSEPNALMPLINANNAGYVTGVQLQNAGSAASDVTVSYTPVPGLGTACTETHTIQPGASATYALAAFAGLGGGASDCTHTRFVGGAQITGNSTNQPVVAVVNQTTSTQAGAYDAFLPTQTTSKVVFPLIMDRNSGWYTGFTVANVSQSTVHVVCTFTNTAYQVTGDLTPGGVILDIQNNKITNKYVGSGTCVATLVSGADAPKIVGVVNEIAPGSGDTLLTYEGINVAP